MIYTPAFRAGVISAYESGHTVARICSDYLIDYRDLYRWLDAAGAGRRMQRKDFVHGAATRKVSLAAVREFHALGWSDRRIAKTLGRSITATRATRVKLKLAANYITGGGTPRRVAIALALLLLSGAAHAEGWQAHPVERPDPFAAMRNIENGQPGFSCCSGLDCAYTDTCTTTDGAAGVIGPDNGCHAVTDAASMTRGCPGGHTSACFIGTKSDPKMICACVGDS